MNFSMIVAFDKNRGIGKDGTIPWRIPQDMKRFKEITQHIKIDDPTLSNSLKKQYNVVIMGRNTWFSIPKKFRPLPKRLNIILSSNKIPDVEYCFNSLSSALNYCQERNDIANIFLIGGERLYREGMEHPGCNKLYITEVMGDYNCDRFFPQIDMTKWFERSCSVNQLKYKQHTYLFKKYVLKSSLSESCS